MRLGIKGKQVLGVTSIVGTVVVVLSLLHLSRLATVGLDESRARAELLANAIYHRAREVVNAGVDPYQALRGDPGLRSILESSLYSESVTFAAIADTSSVAVVHQDRSLEGQPLPPGEPIQTLLDRRALAQLLAVYSGQGRNIEFRQPLLLGEIEFGSIRIGISTLLIRDQLSQSLRPALATALAALAVSVIVATLLSQRLLRPIHVIRSGLTRLGRGELGVRLDLDQQDEFGELGTFFNAVSEQLSVDRTQMAGQVANLESAVEHLDDAVAILNARGQLLFANPAMRVLLPAAAVGTSVDDLLPGDHPVRELAEQTFLTRQSRGPVSVEWTRGQTPSSDPDRAEHVVMTHPISDPKGGLMGIMLVVRNMEYLSQVQSTIRYSRKLAALGRLSAGVAHEVKNPLNAMMIHLELLRQQLRAAPGSTRREPQGRSAPGRATAAPPRADLAGAHVEVAPPCAAGDRREPIEPRAALATLPEVDATGALQHVDVIAREIKRLDEVVQGFLRFSRPEDLALAPVQLATLFDAIMPIVGPEAERSGVDLIVDCHDVPDVNGDPAMLRQAFLNLALNACQAMPTGGSLRIHCAPSRGRRVSIAFTDTGVGIELEHLPKIFDLYFTTRGKGSGIGLSMVYRTVQMHDGEIEVQSTPGKGTTFTVLLPQA